VPEAARLRRWQAVTVATLFAGYAGYYACRSVLPVASNGMMNDPSSGIDEVGYACGEVVAGDVVAGQLVKHPGFDPLLDVLLWVGVATCAAGAAYWYFEERLLKSLAADESW
jgi:hypothetical protein